MWISLKLTALWLKPRTNIECSGEECILYRQKLPDFMLLVDADNTNKNINGMHFIKHMLCAQNFM